MDTTIRRNSPCPCGGGSRYKHCCGQLPAVEPATLERKQGPDRASKTQDYDSTRVTEGCELFASRLLERLPHLTEYARMVREAVQPVSFDFPERSTPALYFNMQIPSPTGDPEREVNIWTQDGASLEFGGWHTHGQFETASNNYIDKIDAIIDLVEAILTDKLVLEYAIDNKDGEFLGLLDLRFSDGLNHVKSSKPTRIKTWSGKGDGVMQIRDMKLESPLG